MAQHTKATRDVRRRVGTTESTIRGGHARDTRIASSLSASGADNMENSSRFKYDRQQDTRGTNLWLAGRSSDDMTQGVVTQVKIRTVFSRVRLSRRVVPRTRLRCTIMTLSCATRSVCRTVLTMWMVGHSPVKATRKHEWPLGATLAASCTSHRKLATGGARVRVPPAHSFLARFQVVCTSYQHCASTSAHIVGSH